VYCWGGNDAGMLGDGTRTARVQPVAVRGPSGFVALDVGAAHSCTLTAGGTAWCWGHNDEGQLGDGSFLARDVPVAVAGAPSFAQISAGHAHGCALTGQGAAYCWGDDSQGQLGDGDEGGTRSPTPVPVATAESFTHITAGYYQTCALTAAGAAYCWGLGSSGQNGDDAAESRTAPVRVAGGRTFLEIAAGDRFVCADAAGQPWCWGALTGSAVPVPQPAVPAVQGVVASLGASTIPGAAAYACGIAADGRPWCWGGSVRALREAGAAPLGTSPDGVAIAAGAQHVCILDERGYAYCGGGNYAGQVGDGTHTDRGALVPVAAPAEDA
jgi:alpha-tubulin suppressor-like RCC1 family protein